MDEKGVTHYGERPPDGKKAAQVEPRLATPGLVPANSPQPSWKDKDLEYRSRRVETQQAEVKQEQQRTAQRLACNQARDRLAQMKLARRVYQLDEKGERVYQSDEERNASAAELEQVLAQRCR